MERDKCITGTGNGDENTIDQTVQVPDGEIWYVENLYVENTDGTDSLNSYFGISHVPFSDLEFGRVRDAERSVIDGVPGTLRIEMYAYGGDRIGINLADHAGGLPYKLTIRRVV